MSTSKRNRTRKSSRSRCENRPMGWQESGFNAKALRSGYTLIGAKGNIIMKGSQMISKGIKKIGMALKGSVSRNSARSE